MKALELGLPMTPAAAAAARHALGNLSGRLDPERLTNVRLLVSELVTNAVRHARIEGEARIALTVDVDQDRVRVVVADAGEGFDPVPPPGDPARTSGWGLFLVDTVADRWGVERRDGTRVWFELDTPPPA